MDTDLPENALYVIIQNVNMKNLSITLIIGFRYNGENYIKTGH